MQIRSFAPAAFNSVPAPSQLLGDHNDHTLRAELEALAGATLILRIICGLEGTFPRIHDIKSVGTVSRERIRQRITEIQNKAERKASFPLLNQIREIFAKRTAVGLNELAKLLGDELNVDPYGLARVLHLKYHPQVEALAHKNYDVPVAQAPTRKQKLSDGNQISVGQREKLSEGRGLVVGADGQTWYISECQIDWISQALLKVLVCNQRHGIRTGRFQERMFKMPPGLCDFRNKAPELMQMALLNGAEKFPFALHDGRWIPTETLIPENIFTASEYKLYALLKEGSQTFRKIRKYFNQSPATIRGVLQNLPFTQVTQTMAQLVKDERDEEIQIVHEGAELDCTKNWVYVPVAGSHIVLIRRRGLITGFEPLAAALGQDKFEAKMTNAGIRLLNLTPDQTKILAALRMNIPNNIPKYTGAKRRAHFQDMDADQFTAYASRYRVAPGTLLQLASTANGTVVLKRDNGHYTTPDRRFHAVGVKGSDGRLVQVAQVLWARVYDMNAEERFSADEIEYLRLNTATGIQAFPIQTKEGDTTEIYTSLNIAEVEKGLERRIEMIREANSVVNAGDAERTVATIKMLDHENARLKVIRQLSREGFGKDPITVAPQVVKPKPAITPINIVIPLGKPKQGRSSAPAPHQTNYESDAYNKGHAQKLTNLSASLADIVLGGRPALISIKENLDTTGGAKAGLTLDAKAAALCKKPAHTQIVSTAILLNLKAKEKGINALLQDVGIRETHIEYTFCFQQGPVETFHKQLATTLSELG